MINKLLALSVPGSGTIQLPSQINTIVSGAKNTLYAANIIGWALDIAYLGATVTALGFIIYGGFKWIISNGDAKNLETAHNIIIYAAVGMGIVLISAVFINTAAGIFCIPFLGLLPSSCQ